MMTLNVEMGRDAHHQLLPASQPAWSPVNPGEVWSLRWPLVQKLQLKEQQKGLWKMPLRPQLGDDPGKGEDRPPRTRYVP